jgi:FtsP/CotA-like multicopper oxidase with cupredoxin domain
MTRSQRLTFLGLAAVIAVVAVVILVGAGGSRNSGDERAATPVPTTTATAEPQQASPAATATADPGPLLTGAKEQQIDATEGDTVRFRVKADQDDEVHVHGYDLEKPVAAGQTVTLSFKASITGIFEIEFHHSGAVLARLKVQPH